MITFLVSYLNMFKFKFNVSLTKFLIVLFLACEHLCTFSLPNDSPYNCMFYKYSSIPTSGSNVSPLGNISL